MFISLIPLFSQRISWISKISIGILNHRDQSQNQNIKEVGFQSYCCHKYKSIRLNLHWVKIGVLKCTVGIPSRTGSGYLRLMSEISRLCWVL
jgi:hypothetical protein